MNNLELRKMLNAYGFVMRDCSDAFAFSVKRVNQDLEYHYLYVNGEVSKSGDVQITVSAYDLSYESATCLYDFIQALSPSQGLRIQPRRVSNASPGVVAKYDLLVTFFNKFPLDLSYIYLARILSILVRAPGTEALKTSPVASEGSSSYLIMSDSNRVVKRMSGTVAQVQLALSGFVRRNPTRSYTVYEEASIDTIS